MGKYATLKVHNYFYSYYLIKSFRGKNVLVLYWNKVDNINFDH